MDERKLDRCISRFATGSAEREYHEAIFRFLESLQFPLKREVGLTFLRVLQGSDFQIGSVDTTVHPVAGSLYENADLVACVFGEVSDDPDWWIANYQALDEEQLISMSDWLGFWIHCFRDSQEVVHFSYP